MSENNNAEAIFSASWQTLKAFGGNDAQLSKSEGQLLTAMTAAIEKYATYQGKKNPQKMRVAFNKAYKVYTKYSNLPEMRGKETEERWGEIMTEAASLAKQFQGAEADLVSSLLLAILDYLQRSAREQVAA